MAEFKSILGKLRGRVGDLVMYEGRDGRMVVKGAGGGKPKSEGQVRQMVAFREVGEYKYWLGDAIWVGFMGEGKRVRKGEEDFVRANLPGAVRVVERGEDGDGSGKGAGVEERGAGRKGRGGRRRRKWGMEDFRGEPVYEVLRVAAGPLEVPVVEVEVDGEERVVRFRNRRAEMERVDCFGDDRVYGVAVERGSGFCRVVGLGRRDGDGEGWIALAEGVRAEGLALYAFAVGADGEVTSDSVCLRVPEGWD